MNSRRLRIAIPTKGDRGLEDTVSEVFGRANTFTIIDLEDNGVIAVDVLKNPTVSYKYGSGPIVVNMLIERGVNMVVAGELGPGASGLLEQNKVSVVTVKPGILVAEVIKLFKSK
ncbi:MAG: NifB/NifX family molybdenum-iron cluster-binding protein [Thermoproteota archaeon]